MGTHQLGQPEERRYFSFKGFALCKGTDAEVSVHQLGSYFLSFTSNEALNISLVPPAGV